MRRSIVLFAKNPTPGSVKTRLTPPLSPVQAAELAAAFLTDSSQKLIRSGAERCVVAYSPTRAEAAVRDHVGDGLELEPQGEGDLGARMETAVASAFDSGSSAVVLVGSDSPTLPVEYLQEALDALQQVDLVLGPSLDLGYYLIGLRAPQPELFRGIPWSTGRVLGATLEATARAGLSLHLLRPWYDIDTVVELRFLKAHLEALSLSGKDSPAPRTSLVLSTLNIPGS